ncbi:MAG: aminotransferase class V-fold PLP-dependent enzyme [Bacteroidota bacterium]
MAFNIQKVRSDFPILSEKLYKKYPLVYLDNGATTQKPKVVIDTINDWHSHKNSSIHRGVHYLSEQATEAYEHARKTVQTFINAKHSHEIVFTSGATGAVNGLAFSFGEDFVTAGDEILITEMEHHANIVPWQMLCQRKGATLKYVPIDDNGELQLDLLPELITARTRLLAIMQVSNSLGTINPVKKIIEIAHNLNVPVMVDAAQSVQHENVDVQDLDCDFLVFSGHKIYGPTGIGVFYGKEAWLEKLVPFQGGGDMVDVVTLEKTTFNELPFKFEAGTTNYIGAIGLGVALDYVNKLSIKDIKTYEHGLLQYATEKLSSIEGLKIFGQAKNKAAIISFLLEGIHQYDAGMVLDKLGIAVRTGTHCTQPVMQHFDIEGTIRASMCFYNTEEDIDRLVEGIQRVQMMFG